jgi:hypothetical protein
MNLIIIVLIFCIILFLILFLSYEKFNTSKNKKNIELVIARYNENLEWLNTEPYNKYSNIIYNKGINDNFNNNILTKRIIKLNNLGRCDETYLNHIVNNYDNLADITIFLPGSLNIDFKDSKAKLLINEIEKHQDTVFISNKYNNVKKDLYDFQLDYWVATGKENNNINPESKLELSAIRPFGKWYDTYFKWDIQHVSYLGIIGISRKDILNHPKSYYQTFLDQLQKSSNPEVGHYIERSWEAIFYKFNNPIYIELY